MKKKPLAPWQYRYMELASRAKKDESKILDLLRFREEMFEHCFGKIEALTLEDFKAGIAQIERQILDFSSQEEMFRSGKDAVPGRQTVQEDAAEDAEGGEDR